MNLAGPKEHHLRSKRPKKVLFQLRPKKVLFQLGRGCGAGVPFRRYIKAGNAAELTATDMQVVMHEALHNFGLEHATS